MGKSDEQRSALAPAFVEGAWRSTGERRETRDVYSGTVLGHVLVSTPDDVRRALEFIREYPKRPIAPYRRYEILAASAEIVAQRKSLFVATVVAETGFLVSEAEREVDRTVETLRLSAEEAKRLVGHVVPVAADPTAPSRLGFTLVGPVGVVAAITPYNSPLNMIAHKAGPALAAGNSVIVKPSEVTAFSANLMIQALLDAGLPTDALALVHGGAEVGAELVASPVPAFFAFTGSTRVGLEIARNAGLRRTQLELGSISHTIIAEDADLERAVEACIRGGFRKAGQVCTSVQKILVAREKTAAVVDLLRQGLEGRVAGDPRDPRSFIGPVISESAASRIESWVNDAIAGGAELVVGGRRSGNLVFPTVLVNASPTDAVSCQEIFGPVIVVEAFDDFEDAIERANASPYGLAGGVFTSSIARALAAAERLQVGSLHINESSSSRLDLMPFGGLKDSGHGLEGPAYAIREMSQERFITIAP